MESRLEIDANGLSPREVNRKIREVAHKGIRSVRLTNLSARHYLVSGVLDEIDIYIDGSVGFYAGSMIEGPRLFVNGNSDWFTGDNMTDGEIIINGHAGNGLGQGIYGGTIVSMKDAGDRVGALMKRGTIIVNGNVGVMTGLYMMGGRLIVLGDLGNYTGESIIGGSIVFSGKVRSFGKNATLTDFEDKEKDEILELLDKYKIKITPGSLKKIGIKEKRPFYKGKDIPKNIVLKNLSPSYSVDIKQEVCIKCGACVEVCPSGVYEWYKEKVYPLHEANCVNCQYCMNICPTHAITVRPLPIEKDTIWNKFTYDEIIYKTSNGKHIVRGTGAKKRFPDFDELVFLNAQTSRPPIDGYREPCNTSVSLGKKDGPRLHLGVPIVIGAMSFGSLSKEAKISIAKAASKFGIAVNTGEGGILPEERENASILIAQYASGRFGISARALQSADAIEIKIGQGAKAGQGGLLLSEKVSSEISAIRGIPMGTDAVSPSRHLDIVGPEDLKMKIDQLREITEGKVPIIIKYAAGRVKDDVKIAAKAGADIITVDGAQGGTGAAPDVILENTGIPALAAVVEAHEALIEINMRDNIGLIISGGIRNGADVAKALALGADAVAISTAVLVAMGCKGCGICHSGKCPWGIATQNPSLRRRLKIDVATQRIENYLESTIHELTMLVQVLGKTDVRNLEREDLRALTLNVSEITGLPFVGT